MVVEINCDGEEKHSHYSQEDSMLMYHTHNHTASTKEFNRMHHHAPKEHEGLSFEELEYTETLEVPF